MMPETEVINKEKCMLKGKAEQANGELQAHCQPQGPQTALSSSAFAALGRLSDNDDEDSDETPGPTASNEQGGHPKKGRKLRKDKNQGKADENCPGRACRIAARDKDMSEDEYLDRAMLLATQEREDAA